MCVGQFGTQKIQWKSNYRIQWNDCENLRFEHLSLFSRRESLRFISSWWDSILFAGFLFSKNHFFLILLRKWILSWRFAFLHAQKAFHFLYAVFIFPYFYVIKMIKYMIYLRQVEWFLSHVCHFQCSKHTSHPFSYQFTVYVIENLHPSVRVRLYYAYHTVYSIPFHGSFFFNSPAFQCSKFPSRKSLNNLYHDFGVNFERKKWENWEAE